MSQIKDDISIIITIKVPYELSESIVEDIFIELDKTLSAFNCLEVTIERKEENKNP